MRAMRSAASRERERMLEGEACQDYLTGLLNRRGLEAAADALDGKDMPLAVYLFDLDNLKHINDTFGHMRGDQTISAFAELLREQTRESDILSRFGGDEFVVIMKQMKSGESAVKKGEDICRSICEYPFADNVRVVPPVSSFGTPGNLCRPYWSMRTRPCIAPRLKIRAAAVCGKTGMNIHKIRRPCALPINIL